MQVLLFLCIVAAMIASVATGVVYVTQEPERSSIHLDKVRLEEVQKETTEAVSTAVDKVRKEAKEIGENLAGEKGAPPQSPGVATESPQ